MPMTINGVALEVLDRTGCYDYEWSEFAVMRGNDGLLYVGDTGGCSCNDFEENLDEVTKVDSWQDAATKAQEWSAICSGDEKQGCMEMIERLTQSRPVAHE